MITQSSAPLHFTKFLVNEEYTGAFIDGILTVDPIPNYPPVFVTTTPGDTIDENTARVRMREAWEKLISYPMTV